jgi:hypothetical protein
MKIAVLGSASSSVNRAPFKDSQHAAWMQGRVESLQQAHDAVPGDWDIWGCSPGCWAVCPRATRWFELHRWETNVPWFSPEYVQFLRSFKGPVYTGGVVPEVQNHVVYPIDYMEEKFSSYFMTSSLALMVAMAIDTIEQLRMGRSIHREYKGHVAALDAGVPSAPPRLSIPSDMANEQFEAELDKADDDDVIGLWGVDMAAQDEYAYQRPGCQFFILEAMRRGIGVYLPAESDLMRPMPVYGISEWDHNYIKLTTRARELNQMVQAAQKQMDDAKVQVIGGQGEQHALQAFVNTWTSPYGMLPGMVIRQAEGTGLGSGITHFDGRPISRMTVAPPALPPAAAVVQAMADPKEAQLGRELCAILLPHAGERGQSEGAAEVLQRIIHERDVLRRANEQELERIVREREARARVSKAPHSHKKKPAHKPRR